MKRTTLCAITALFALSFSMSSTYAQGHRGGSHNKPHSAIGNVRGGGNHNSGPNNQGYRPGNTNNGKHNGNHNSNNQGFRPGNTNNGKHNGNHNGNNQGFRPGNNYRPEPAPARPGNNYRPAPAPVRPGTNYRPGVTTRPYRPHVAPARPFVRPVPPVSWRPAYRVNLWSSILGVTVGMTISNTINALINSGQTVDGYGSNEVYLRNVNQYGYLWPDATMFYNNGGFVGSRFHYSTLAYNMGRYRDVFSYLTSLYGAPISTNSDSAGTTATWWGEGNQYITLSYGPMLTDSGQRYFTTLSIGI